MHAWQRSLSDVWHQGGERPVYVTPEGEHSQLFITPRPPAELPSKFINNEYSVQICMLCGHRPVLKELVKDYTDMLPLLTVLYAGST